MSPPAGASVLCPGCGFGNASGIKFCGECGRRLGTAPGPGGHVGSPTPRHLAAKILGARAALYGERKQVTVLFADVKGSMELAERVDPEEWHKILERFFVILAEGVHRFEGTVNQYTGDGIMALFGAPLAHEDHAQRACWAALHLAAELRKNAQSLRRERGLDFAVRMGLNSGEVVVGTIGDDLHMDYTALGHTVGLAQRVEQIAAADRVYLTEHTARLVAGYFRLDDLGPFNLKGVREPVRIHELQGPGAQSTRLEAVGRRRGFSRFVGRERETARLEAALARALAGDGQIVDIVADAGVGKSRLCHEFAERCRSRGVAVHRAHGVAHGKTLPLLPILQVLRGYFGVSDQDRDEEARRKVAGTLLLLDRELADDAPLLLDFLGIPDPDRRPPRMDPEARQRRLLDIVQRLARARSRREPAVILLEDLHWFDEASERFVQAIAATVPGTRTLLVVNYRPEYRAEWAGAVAHSIRLEPLGDAAIADLLRELLGADPSVAPLGDRIRERTAGNPFFVEEVVQSLVESGALEGSRGGYRLGRPVTELAIPSTVHALLAARIDRLPERERLVLHTAAVIGREFPGPLLARIVDLPGPELTAALSALAAAELVHEQALSPETPWAFEHPLTQEVAYRSQLGDRRARVHAAVARAIEALWPGRLDERAALLAYHWEAAGEPLEAARWSRRAAEWAGARDIRAAVGHWRKVRAVLAAVPESDETIALGLIARTRILGLSWTLGMPAEEAATLVAEGRELASRGGDAQSRAMLLGMQQLTQRMHGGSLAARLEDAVEAVRLADEAPDLGVRLGLRVNLIASFYEAGRLAEALRATEEALAIPVDDVMLGAELTSVSPRIWFGMFRGLLLEASGRLDEALPELARALDLAREHQDGELVAQVQWCLSTLAYTQGDDEAATRHAQQAVEAAEKIGSAFARVLSGQMLGQAQLMRGDAQAALASLERALAVGQESNTARQLEADVLAGSAEALSAAGRCTAARETALRAVAAGRERGTMMWELAANLALARVLLRDPGAAARADIEGALARAHELIGATGAAKYLPFVHLERARLAGALGNEAARREELRAAQRRFTEIGAAQRAESTARELEA